MKYYFLLFLILFISFPALAIDYAEKAHDAFMDKDYVSAGEFYEKAFDTEKAAAYLDNAAAAYLTHAFNLSNDKEYDQAIIFCEKVLALKPDSRDAKELLSEIYYSRGSDYYFAGNREQASVDMENSLKYSVYPEQKQRILQELKDWKILTY